MKILFYFLEEKHKTSLEFEGLFLIFTTSKNVKTSLLERILMFDEAERTLDKQTLLDDVKEQLCS